MKWSKIKKKYEYLGYCDCKDEKANGPMTRLDGTEQPDGTFYFRLYGINNQQLPRLLAQTGGEDVDLWRSNGAVMMVNPYPHLD
jgi:hypothetical protein